VSSLTTIDLALVYHHSPSFVWAQHGCVDGFSGFLPSMVTRGCFGTPGSRSAVGIIGFG
jgi:hypothetical protein